MNAENKHHIFIELMDGKVRDARMLTLDEIRANGEGWEPDLRNRDHNVSSDWVRDPDTRQKLRDERCDLSRMRQLLAYVSVAAYPATKRIEPLFGYGPSAPPT